MAGEAAHLRETLEQLHRQLEDAGPIDADLRESLTEAIAEIRARLDAPDETTSAPRTLVERLERSALDFEAEHPVIAGTINRLTHALSSMGI